MSELLNLPRMAHRVGVTQGWLREQADAGAIPSLRAGNRLLFNPVAVMESLSAKAGNPSRQKSEEGEVPRA